jgi:hypothetical protein
MLKNAPLKLVSVVGIALVLCLGLASTAQLSRASVPGSPAQRGGKSIIAVTAEDASGGGTVISAAFS